MRQGVVKSGTLLLPEGQETGLSCTKKRSECFFPSLDYVIEIHIQKGRLNLPGILRLMHIVVVIKLTKCHMYVAEMYWTLS